MSLDNVLGVDVHRRAVPLDGRGHDDDQGDRASLVFTLESSLLERFAHIDRELIGNFRFLVDKQPTPASQAESARHQPGAALPDR